MEPGSLTPAAAGVPSKRMAATIQPTVLVLDSKWRALVPHAERMAARAAAAAGGAGTVVLSTDRAVKALNGLHRNKNKPTNVLTFDFGSGFLGGDIVLALGTVRREALAAGRPASHHLAHLVVHGALHLRGHDHHHVGDARRMEMEEARILSTIGVPNPWKRR
jgi:probable rRNA maturation factor